MPRDCGFTPHLHLLCTSLTQPRIMTEKVIQKTKEHTIAVLYSDGSAKPTNPGVIGWSVHGYTITGEPATRGAGHPKVVPTNTGYIEKTATPVCAQVTQYYDYLGWQPTVTSNNAAEILGCSQAFKWASTMPELKHLMVYSDSKYVVNGVTSQIGNWVTNNWIKRDGNPVSNQSEWKELLTGMDVLRSNGTKVTVEWVKGHGTNFGNIKADQLAGIGSEIALTATERGENQIISPPEGYWKSDIERNPLFGLRGWFFTVSKELSIKGEYFLSNQVKSDEFIGRRVVDGSFGYVLLTQPDTLLELVRDRQIEMAREFDTLAMVRVDRVYDKALSASLQTYGSVVLRRKKRHANDLYFVNEDVMAKPSEEDGGAEKSMPITEELYPPRLAMRCITEVSSLKYITNQIKTSIETSIELPTLADTCIFDITDIYFDVVKGKGDKLIKQFKKNIKVADQSLSFKKNAFGQEITIQQIFGIHVLNRNNLKRLEETDVQVWVVVNKVSEHAIRYITVVKSNNDWSAWAGVHSNLVVFKDKLQ